jgi:hypothetical protein
MRTNQTFVIGVLCAAVVLLARLDVEAQQATRGLAFYQTVTAATNAGFERLERPGEAAIYVARAAALVINTDEITAVVLTREPIYADTASVTEAVRRQLALPGQPQPMQIAGHVYLATMHVDTQAAQRVHTFTAKHVGQRVDVRFNGTRLGVPKILGPASSEFGISLDGWTRAQIEQVFAVLRARLTWPVDER